MDDRLLHELIRHLEGLRIEGSCSTQLDLPTLEAIARGTLIGEDAERAREHLRECLPCLNAYAELLSLLERPAVDTAAAPAEATLRAGRPDPRFSRSDVVQRLNQPEAVGVVLDVRWDPQAESWNYSVQFGAQLRVVPEEALEPFRALESPWDALLRGNVSGARHFIFTLTYHRLRRPPTRIAYSFATSRTEFYPHQFMPLLKFLDHPAKRLLIADDVGLGKTIEAGYILRELRARQVVERVLVVVPARLTPKWKRELQMRFDEPFDVVRGADLIALAEGLRHGREIEPFRWIVSYEHMRPEDVRAALEETQPPIDVLIVDEAHRLRKPETLQHKAAATLCKIADVALFLTATPVQNSLEDLWNLLRLLSPEEFESWPLFQNQIDANRPLLLAQRALALRPPRVKEAAASLAAFLENPAGAQFAETEIARSIIGRLRTAGLQGKDLVELRADIGRLSPTGHIITRTRKADALPHRPRREAGWVRVALTPTEKDVFQSVAELCRMTLGGDEAAWGFRMALLRYYQMIASSIPAAFQYFAERLKISPSSLLGAEPVADDEGEEQENEAPRPPDLGSTVLGSASARSRIVAAIGAYERIAGTDTKLECAVRELRRLWREDDRVGRRRRKVVLFSTFRPTLAYLQAAFDRRRVANRMIHGGIPVEEREQAIDEFLDREDVPVLLTSEVGGEGVDLQRACVVVNYDLPWNPMVVEQRIGRVDRIGQESPRIVVLNLVVAESVEELILQRLLEKLGIFKASIGELDPIIGDEIQRLTERALRGELAKEELERAVEETGETLHRRILAARQVLARLDSLLAADQAIIDEIHAVTGERQLPSEGEMRPFLNDFLAERFHGCQIPEEAIRRVVSLHLTDGLPAALEQAATDFGADAQSMVRFARRASGGPVEVTLSREASYRHPRADLLHLRHPLVRFAIREVDKGRSRLHKAFALSVEKSRVLPAGLYVFAISVIEFPGYRPTIKLVGVVVDAAGDRVWTDPEQGTPIILELLEAAEDLELPPLGEGILEAAKARAVSALNSLLAEWSAREQRLDHVRREQQHTALRTTLEFRLQRARARLVTLEQQQAAPFAIRMAQAQVEKARRQVESLMAEAPAPTWPGVEQEEIAVGVLRVGNP